MDQILQIPHDLEEIISNPDTPREVLLRVAETLEELKRRQTYQKYSFLFTDSGKYARSHYTKHVEFFAAGLKYNERLFSAGNQTGKTTALLYEGVTHALLAYEDWWPGKRFHVSTVIIFGAKTWEQIRDGLQSKLLGETELGTGLIPLDRIVNKISASGTPGCYAQIWVKNNLGGVSKILFKTYDSKQTSWESLVVHAVFFDEEPPLSIYVEGSIRTMRNGGVTAIGFTPDDGMTETVSHFFRGGDLLQGASEDKFIAMVGWDDVPHLSTKDKQRMLQLIPEYLREAKMKGIPYLGIGRIFAFDLDPYFIPPFEIPEHYEQFYGFDPGISAAAVIWYAFDPDSQITYGIRELLMKNVSALSLVVTAIKEPGDWIPGSIDPFYASQKRACSMEDVQRIGFMYQKAGLLVQLAPRNTVESGLRIMQDDMLRGKLKYFFTCSQFRVQLNLLHRIDGGKIGNTAHDLVDAARYGYTDGKYRGISLLEYNERTLSKNRQEITAGQTSRDNFTGY